MPKNDQRKAITKWAEEKPKLDGARELPGSYFFPDDGLDYEDKHEQCKKKIANMESLSDVLQKSPNQPTRTVLAGSDAVQVTCLKLKRND